MLFTLPEVPSAGDITLAPPTPAPVPASVRKQTPALWMRPVRPDDATLLDRFFQDLSPQSRLRRFHVPMRGLSPDLLERFTHPDPEQELALLAFVCEGGRQVCAGEARYALSDEVVGEREFALTVADRWQRAGVGRGLLARLTAEARRRGVTRRYGDVLRDNRAMIALASSLGYAVLRHPGDWRLLRVAMRFAATCCPLARRWRRPAPPAGPPLRPRPAKPPAGIRLRPSARPSRQGCLCRPGRSGREGHLRAGRNQRAQAADAAANPLRQLDLRAAARARDAPLRKVLAVV